MKRIINCISRLWLGALLIAGCSGVLLYLSRTHSTSSSEKPEVAILTISSRTVMEDFLKGCHDLFAERGYEDGKNIEFKFYNPQGDLTIANMMADDILQRGPSLVITASTPMLQVMANKNRNGIVRHIFGLVTDPFSAVEGFDRTHPEHHPDHIGGYGSFQPVDSLFRQLIALKPGLKRVGTVRNAGEACSEATFKKAKKFCEANGIELLDFTVESPAAVKEAIQAVIESNVEAIWIGGDNTVEAAIELVVNEADKVGLPVFTHSPTHLKFGTTISLGADYYEVARITAKLAVDVLEGKATLKDQKIVNMVPELLALNAFKLKKFATNMKALSKLVKQAV
ncbi:MAG: ABC transporter substrate-binding protein, partial [Victivallales bacterium]|nr:ABC transporter substrate-binding protein [Victivallales bacterium]